MKKYDRPSLIHCMARIRRFELLLLDLFSRGELFGTTHTCVGQEACAAALYVHIDPERDAVFSNHRCHGHFLAYGGSMEDLMAEIMGKAGGVCNGLGGSQHLCEGRFFSNAIQGGGVPIALGYAYRTKLEGKKGIVVAHIGDGTLGQGVVYETMNMASMLALPMLVVVEHNGYAQSTDTSRTTAGDVEMRFRAFGIETDRRKADDPFELAQYLTKVVGKVRENRPFVQILDTFRLMGHSKGDDARPEDLVKQAWKQDFLQRLLDRNDPDACKAWEQAGAEVQEVYERARSKPFASLKDRSAFFEDSGPLVDSSEGLVYHPPAGDGQRLRINELLNQALDRLMADHPEVMVIGEDLLDPYGGAFKVTKGLSTEHPEQVFSTPISEAGIVGFGNGVALNGGFPVVEIMFGDFVTLAMDQLINQASKMHFMYAGKVSVPLTLRLVSGGYRGYGPTHSQCLESRLCGVPGLKVVALSRRHDPGSFLAAGVLRDKNPVIFVENKLLYPMRPHADPPPAFRFVPCAPLDNTDYPPLAFTSTGSEEEKADVTVVTYGGLSDMVEAAMETLILEEELEFDYFILSQLSPLRIDYLLDSLATSRKLLVVEEGPEAYGIGAELVAQATARLGADGLTAMRVASKNVPIPCSRLQEAEVLPSKERVVQAILDVLE